jgi:DNA-nicking Smr family endonuclease
MPRGRAPDDAHKALAELRRQLAAAPRRTRPASDSSGSVKAERARASVPSDEDAATLLRTSLGEIKPIRDTRRAELDTPKPAPLPRQRGERELPAVGEAAGQLAEDDDALFRAMFGDVTPLRGSSRAALDQRTCSLPQAPADEVLSGFETDPPLPLLPPSADDLDAAALLALALRGTRTLGDIDRVLLDGPAPPPEPRQREQDEQAALHETLHAPVSLEDRLETGEEAAFIRPGLPRRVLTDLRRGRWVRQAELDLHGMNRDEARSALVAFLNNCLLRGHRCVRIIHGKGLGSPGRQSILKQLSRGWLAQRDEILAFCQASPHHGGGGALMVLIRGQNPERRRGS